MREQQKKPTKTYSSYGAAMEDCDPRGYQESDIVNAVIEKTKIYRDELLRRRPIRLGVAHSLIICSIYGQNSISNDVKILDFGGAAGHHYFLVRSVIPKETKLKWAVVETPAMASLCAGVFSSDELYFVSDITEAKVLLGCVDIVHTSGALQCVDDPVKYINKLVETDADQIVLNRLGLTKGRQDIITVHESLLSDNGPGPLPPGIKNRTVRYPFTFPGQDRIFGPILKKYTLNLAVDDSSGAFPVNDEPIFGIGLSVVRSSALGKHRGA
jgi:putative methyltransferase (TIGR04325 family)